MALTSHVALSSLLSAASSIVTKFNELHRSYKFMPQTLSSIVLTCVTIRSSLDRVHLTLKDYSGTTRDSHQNLVDQFEGIKIACAIDLSLLETHVSALLDVAIRDVPLIAQNTSTMAKLKALYNDSDMKELFRRLTVYVTLLNTIQNNLQSDKQDQMIAMITNQEKTLQIMVQAQQSLRKHLRTADTSLDNDSDAASIRTCTTTMTTLTMFDFDAIIEESAVYQRCMKRRSDRTGFLSLALSAVQFTPSSEAEEMSVKSREAHTAEHSPPVTISDTQADSSESVSDSDLEAMYSFVVSHLLPRLLYHHDGKITHIAISSNRVLATLSFGVLRLWDLSTGKSISRLSYEAYCDTGPGPVFSPDGRLLAIAHLEGEESNLIVSVWTPGRSARLLELRIQGGSELWISAIAFSWDNELMACSQENRKPLENTKSTVVLYKTATGEEVGRLPQLQSRVRALSFAWEDRRLLCCDEKRLEIWDVATLTLDRTSEQFDDSSIANRLSIASHPIFMGDFMICTDGFNGIDMFDLVSGKRRASVAVAGRVTCLACSPDTREIAFAGHNNLVGTWDPMTKTVRRPPLENHFGGGIEADMDDDDHDGETNLEAVAISPDGQTIAFGSSSGSLRIWNVHDELDVLSRKHNVGWTRM